LLRKSQRNKKPLCHLHRQHQSLNPVQLGLQHLQHALKLEQQPQAAHQLSLVVSLSEDSRLKHAPAMVRQFYENSSLRPEEKSIQRLCC